MTCEWTDGYPEPHFYVREVRSLPAFDAVIAPAMRRHREEEATWIRLPYPAASEVEARMHDAWDVVCALWQELELQDETGAAVPIPVQGFNGHVLSLAEWEAPAGVLARLADRYRGGSRTEPPAV